MKSQTSELKCSQIKSNPFSILEDSKKSQEINKIRNKLFSMAAHDLKNPLASIKGFSEILLKEISGPLNNEQKEFITTINKLTSESIKMVDELLDLSVIESGNLSLILKTESLDQLLKERIIINQVIANNKNISIIFYDSDIPKIQIDKNRIKQVIDNLIGNAIKYSPNKSKIFINIYKQGEYINFSVKDQGPGITAKDKIHLFSEFKILSNKPTAGEISTGLGLAITKRIIEAHKGIITVLSKTGEGSEFIISLPL